MKKSSSLRQQIKVLYNRFKLVYIGYITLLFLYVVVIILLKLKVIPEGAFEISFAASLLEDLIFFGILGLVTLYLSVRKPDEEDFHLRVTSLANGKKVTQQAHKYLSEAIRSILAYNEKLEIKIKIKEVNLRERYIFIHVEQYQLMTNMCRDIRYSVKTMGVTIEPGKFIDKSGGQVTLLHIIDEGNPQNSQYIIDGDPYDISEEKRSFNVPKQDYLIAEDNQINWRLCYRIYGSLFDKLEEKISTNWLLIPLQYFTQRLNLEVTNDTDTDISICVAGIEPNQVHHRLKKKNPYTFAREVYFEKGNNLAIFFYDEINDNERDS